MPLITKTTYSLRFLISQSVLRSLPKVSTLIISKMMMKNVMLDALYLYRLLYDKYVTNKFIYRKIMLRKMTTLKMLIQKIVIDAYILSSLLITNITAMKSALTEIFLNLNFSKSTFLYDRKLMFMFLFFFIMLLRTVCLKHNIFLTISSPSFYYILGNFITFLVTFSLKTVIQMTKFKTES